jgi:hypothetical protein
MAQPQSSPASGRVNPAGDPDSDFEAPFRPSKERQPGWWTITNFSYLMIWWIMFAGYYVVFNTLTGRYQKALIDPDMIYEGWYVILASGIVGALYARRLRTIWFLISVVLSSLILLLMLLCLGTLKVLMNP